MKNKKILIILFLILIPIAHSIGITPAEKIIEFQPLKEHKIKFNIYNNENEAFNAKIEIKGELSEFLKLEKEIIYIPADSKLVPFNIILNMPEKLEKPGFHETDIIVTKLPITEEETQISLAPSVIGKIKIRVPYPGKYIESKLIVETTEKDARFIMPVFNYGTESTEVIATLDIYDKNRTAEIKSNKILLNKNSQGTLEAKWSGNRGNYDVEANINYSNNILKLEKSFNIGSPLINLKKIYIEEYKLGKIAQLDLYLKNIWNKENEVYAELIISDKKELAKTKTASVKLKPYKQDKVSAFLDTAGLTEGTYNLKIILHYNGEFTEKIIKINLTKDRIEGKLIEMPTRPYKTTPLIILAAIIIIATIIYLIRKPPKKKKLSRNRPKPGRD